MQELIISFSHTNYCIRAAGTEKFIRNLSSNLQNQNFCHLNFFAFYNNKNLFNLKGNKLVGVNYNDKLIGIFGYQDIQNIINWIMIEKKLKIRAIHFQHLLNHDRAIIKKIVQMYHVPVFLIAHDYYLVCNHLKLINSKNKFCGISGPTSGKCHDCDYQKEGLEHFKEMNVFLDQIREVVEKIVAPSKYVAEGLKKVYQTFDERIVVRPHLFLEGKTEYLPIKDKIKIAYVGGQFKSKGYDEWKRLVTYLKETSSNQYEFYYLGNGKAEIDGVKNIYVSTTIQGENAMVDQLEKNEITCAFIWPSWAETYSYVYYELAVSGVFVLSNKVSGNICSETLQNENGMIFEDLKACEKWLENTENVKDHINEYRLKCDFRPKQYRENDNLNDLIGGELLNRNNDRLKIEVFRTNTVISPLQASEIMRVKMKNSKPRRKWFQTMSYKVKYFRLIFKE